MNPLAALTGHVKSLWHRRAGHSPYDHDEDAWQKALSLDGKPLTAVERAALDHLTMGTAPSVDAIVESLIREAEDRDDDSFSRDSVDMAATRARVQQHVVEPVLAAMADPRIKHLHAHLTMRPEQVAAMDGRGVAQHG